MNSLWNMSQRFGIESMQCVPVRGAGADAHAMECVAARNDFRGR